MVLPMAATNGQNLFAIVHLLVSPILRLTRLTNKFAELLLSVDDGSWRVCGDFIFIYNSDSCVPVN